MKYIRRFEKFDFSEPKKDVLELVSVLREVLESTMDKNKYKFNLTQKLFNDTLEFSIFLTEYETGTMYPIVRVIQYKHKDLIEVSISTNYDRGYLDDVNDFLYETFKRCSVHNRNAFIDTFSILNVNYVIPELKLGIGDINALKSINKYNL